MTIEEKMKTRAGSYQPLLDLIGVQFGPMQADQRWTSDYVVYAASGDEISTHNAGLNATRHWKFDMYAFGSSYGNGRRIARILQETFVDAVIEGVQSIIPEQGIMPMGFQVETKMYAFSVSFSVWESIS